jgi:glycosyltransferase involved in cell wall biosynthesis
MEISFVVPAHNEEKWIARTLKAIHVAGQALGAPYEVIVADDASTDATATLARANGARVVSVSHRKIGATRNSGARASSGRVLVFVDADTVVNADVVRAAVEALGSGVAGGGAKVLVDGVLPLWARMLNAVFQVVSRVLRFAGGCFLFTTRETFEAVGGFDESLFAGEEIYFGQALKKRGRFLLLRQTVTTSGRKLRAYSGWRILSTMGRLLVRGPRAVKQRQGLELWYEDGREDPGYSEEGGPQ